jgi:hypothetical protein
MKVEGMQAKNLSIDTLLNHKVLTCIVAIKIVLINIIDLDHSCIFERAVRNISDLENVCTLFVWRDVSSVIEITK